MKNKQHHKHTFSIADIKRYVDGNMTPSEMHLLEKAALEDPFLADAIEGVQHSKEVNGPDSLNAELTDLKRRLATTNNRRSPVLWRVAAILLILCTGVAVTFFILEDQPNKNLADQVKPSRSTEEARSLPPAATDSQVRKQDTTMTKQKNQTPARKKDSAPFRNEAGEAAAAIVADHSDTEANRTLEAEKAPNGKADSAIKTEEPLQGKTAGVVVNPSQARQSELSDGDSIELQEVVVTGYAVRKRQNDEPEKRNLSSTRFEPYGGWDAFHRYIADSKTLTAPSGNNIEQVTFTIDKEGKPSNIRVFRSISREHDAETIRLLQNGPRWNLLKGRSRKVTLEIIF